MSLNDGGVGFGDTPPMHPATRSLLVMLAMLAFMRADAQSDRVTLSRENAAQIANALARCAGLLESLADAMRAAGQPASAEELHNLGNGAAVAAQYVLSSEYNERNSPEQRVLKDFEPYVESVSSAAATSFKAMMEQNDQENLDNELNTCVAFAEFQRSIVQEIRDSMVRR